VEKKLLPYFWILSKKFFYILFLRYGMEIPGLALLVPGLMLSSFIDSSPYEGENTVHNPSPSLDSTPVKQYPDAIFSLLHQGERLDGFDLQGQTALMWAAGNGELTIAAHLIKAGADVHATDWWGKTALTYALTYNHIKVVALLMEHGANPSA
jgi:ankyrin repeat protein